MQHHRASVRPAVNMSLAKELLSRSQVRMATTNTDNNKLTPACAIQVVSAADAAGTTVVPRKWQSAAAKEVTLPIVGSPLA
jgi:hypothetical protein